MARFSDSGGIYAFSYPETWIVEQVPDMNGVLLIAPYEEANWQANMFFEIVIDSKNRGLTRFVAETIPHIRERKKNFRLLRSYEAELPTGARAGIFEYTHFFDAELIEWEAMVEIEEDSYLMILASTATVVQDKYQPVFESVLNSIEISTVE